ncbi:hypothetical protein CRG98_050363 [Punica granatum]|uniref:Peptidase A3A domain-containing protein n=1 Tax=Punica granatum TaxID=22663 RepID=A0A2I0GC98_PUNGR|nr:hypothetical protein CRG98_050363 [Punica granatum]
MNSQEIADKLAKLKSRIAQLKVLEQETARLNPRRESISREIDETEKTYDYLSDRAREVRRQHYADRRPTKAELEREQAELHRRNLREQAAKKKSDRERYEEYLEGLRKSQEKMKSKFDRFEEEFQKSFKTPPTFRQPTGKSLRTGAGFTVYDKVPESQKPKKSGIVIYDPESETVRSHRKRQARERTAKEESKKLKAKEPVVHQIFSEDVDSEPEREAISSQPEKASSSQDRSRFTEYRDKKESSSSESERILDEQLDETSSESSDSEASIHSSMPSLVTAADEEDKLSEVSVSSSKKSGRSRKSRPRTRSISPRSISPVYSRSRSLSRKTKSRSPSKSRSPRFPSPKDKAFNMTEEQGDVMFAFSDEEEVFEPRFNIGQERSFPATKRRERPTKKEEVFMEEHREGKDAEYNRNFDKDFYSQGFFQAGGKWKKETPQKYRLLRTGNANSFGSVLDLDCVDDNERVLSDWVMKTKLEVSIGEEYSKLSNRELWQLLLHKTRGQTQNILPIRSTPAMAKENPNATFIKVRILGKPIMAYIDTGASVCFGKPSLLPGY